MKYPNGEEIKVGDLIWWNEGEATGYVQSIIVSEQELREWDLDEPHLFLANIHPFDPTSVAGIGYPQSVLGEDGIQPLSAEERLQLEAATREASHSTGIDFAAVHHAVVVECQDGKRTEWIFSLIEGEEIVEAVRVP